MGKSICEIEPSAQGSINSTHLHQQPQATGAPQAAKSEAKVSGGVKEMKVPAVGESITEVPSPHGLKKKEILLSLMK